MKLPATKPHLQFFQSKGKKFKIEAHQIASQIALHTQYGGVFPMMAKREHSRNIVPLFIQTLKEAKLFKEVESKKLKVESKIRTLLEREQEMIEPFLTEIAKIKKPKIDRIAVTVGPGLEPALWVGINFAKALSVAWNIPLVPVNHMEGHILSVFPKEKQSEFIFTKETFPIVFPACFWRTYRARSRKRHWKIYAYRTNAR